MKKNLLLLLKKKIFVFDFETFKVIMVLEGHNMTIRDCDISNDGNYIITASNDKTLKLWSLQLGKELVTVGHKDWVISCHFSLDSKFIFSASLDGAFKVWDLTGRLLTIITGIEGFCIGVASSRVVLFDNDHNPLYYDTVGYN